MSSGKRQLLELHADYKWRMCAAANGRKKGGNLANDDLVSMLYLAVEVVWEKKKALELSNLWLSWLSVKLMAIKSVIMLVKLRNPLLSAQYSH